MKLVEKLEWKFFKKNDIDELKKQAELCEMCNNVAQTKNTSNTFNSVSLRYKKLQLDYKKKVFVVG